MSALTFGRDRDPSIVRTIRVTRVQAAAIRALPIVETLRSIGVEPHPRTVKWSACNPVDGTITLTTYTHRDAPDGATIRERLIAIIGECEHGPLRQVQAAFGEREWAHVVAAQDAVNAFLRSCGSEGVRMRIYGSGRIKTHIDCAKFCPEGGDAAAHLRNAILRIAGLPERPLRARLTPEERARREEEWRARSAEKQREKRRLAREDIDIPAARPCVDASGRLDWIQFSTTLAEREAILAATPEQLAGVARELGMRQGASLGRYVTRAGSDRLRVLLYIDRLDPLDRRGDLRDRLLIAVGMSPRIDTHGQDRAAYIRAHRIFRTNARQRAADELRYGRGSQTRKAAQRAKRIAHERELVAQAEARRADREARQSRGRCAPLPDTDSRWPRGMGPDDVRPSRVDGLRPVLPQRHSARDAWTWVEC